MKVTGRRKELFSPRLRGTGDIKHCSLSPEVQHTTVGRQALSETVVPHSSDPRAAAMSLLLTAGLSLRLFPCPRSGC